MKIEEVIFGRCSTFPGLTALIAQRTYHMQAPQNAIVPFVTFHQIDAIRYSGMGEDSGIVTARFQFETYAGSSASLLNVKEQVRLALQRWRNPTSNPEVIDTQLADLFNEQVEGTEPAQLFRGVTDVTVHHRE